VLTFHGSQRWVVLTFALLRGISSLLSLPSVLLV
jgi:hypothetical protein